MEIILSNASDRPIYEQITSQIKEMIMKGELKPGEAMPSSSTIFGLDGFIAMDKTQILLIIIPAAFILFALSCLLSIQIYKKRYS